MIRNGRHLSILNSRNAAKVILQSVADKIYDKTIFTDESKYMAFVKDFNKSSVAKVKERSVLSAWQNADDFIANNVRDEFARINAEIQKLNKIYMAAQMEFDKEKVFYPDANSTLRVAYGTVKGYKSKDAVYFTHYTTLKGNYGKR